MARVDLGFLWRGRGVNSACAPPLHLPTQRVNARSQDLLDDAIGASKAACKSDAPAPADWTLTALGDASWQAAHT
jgi:hypothetical protein